MAFFTFLFTARISRGGVAAQLNVFEYLKISKAHTCIQKISCDVSMCVSPMYLAHTNNLSRHVCQANPMAPNPKPVFLPTFDVQFRPIFTCNPFIYKQTQTRIIGWVYVFS